jgi:Carbohydrate family 9 binding domain-like
LRAAPDRRPLALARTAAPLLLACLCCAACERPSSDFYVVHRAPGPIKADGVLDERAWDRAGKAALVRSLDGRPAAWPTEARLLWDDEFLYLAFTCEDHDLRTPFTKDDEALYTSNVVEIFLNPSGDLKRYAEIELSPGDNLFDASFTGPRQGMELAWSSGARHGVHLDGTLNDQRDTDRGWTAELAIPWKNLPGMLKPRPQPGDVWRFNLYRLLQGPGQPNEGQAFRAPLVGDFHAVQRFAELRFAE